MMAFTNVHKKDEWLDKKSSCIAWHQYLLSMLFHWLQLSAKHDTVEVWNDISNGATDDDTALLTDKPIIETQQ